MPTRRDLLAGLAGGTATLIAARAGALPLVRSRSRRVVQRTLEGTPTIEGAGVRLRRVIGQPRLRHIDPFVLLDRFASRDPDDYIRGFPDHPHRGFETITVMLDGLVRHRDSVGNAGTIRGGGVQWMTAGRGIVHSEMPEPVGGMMSGFQFWLNLPAREKMRAPAYQDLTRQQIPQLRLSAGGSLSLIAGDALGGQGAVAPRTTEPMLATLRLEDDVPVRFALPEDHAAFLFVYDGEAWVEGTRVEAGRIGVLSAGNDLEIRAPTMRTGLIVAAARPLREPIVQRGPFVMNTMAEIRQAFADYRNGTLAQ